jgi:hypothetical protein
MPIETIPDASSLNPESSDTKHAGIYGRACFWTSAVIFHWNAGFLFFP